MYVTYSDDRGKTWSAPNVVDDTRASLDTSKGPDLAVPAIAVKDENLLWQLVGAGFAQRRKTILNNLRNAPGPLQEIVKSHGGASIILCEANVDLQRRAETLTLEEWGRIVAVL